MTHDKEIKRAAMFAKKRHGTQLDDNKQNYFEAHLMQVVDILEQITKNPYILSAGYLHDVLEDTPTTYDELKKLFGHKVADLVNEVTHEGQKDETGYYFPRLKSNEAILIKFADRLSNLSRMENWSTGRKSQYLKRSKFWNDGEELL